MSLNKVRQLILFTQNYPFHFSDLYVESEIKLLADYFKNIRIYSFNTDKQAAASIHPSASAQRILIDFERFTYGVDAKILLNREFWDELKDYRSLFGHYPGVAHLKSIYKYWKRAKALQQMLENVLENDAADEPLYIYTTFFTEATLAAIFIKKKYNKRKVFVITRLHRYDLYLNTGEYSYSPFRGAGIRELDSLYFIAQNGLSYFRDAFKNIIGGRDEKLKLFRIGIDDKPKGKTVSKDSDATVFRIVSNSWI
jgi:colanic acid/amylovoran biosynthesis glycosyltransferase